MEPGAAAPSCGASDGSLHSRRHSGRIDEHCLVADRSDATRKTLSGVLPLPAPKTAPSLPASLIVIAVLPSDRL
jgi:hypothetical protein